MPHFAPITPRGLADLLIVRLHDLPGRRVVAIDGADAARPADFAHEAARAVRDTGRTAEVVSTHDYVRPASLRMEYGREDEFSYRTAWFDYDALRREVLDALRAHGRWLPALWDESTDRSARVAVRTAPTDTVLFLAGPMLLGRSLPFDLTVHLDLGPAALRRNTPDSEQWTIPALGAHADENPEVPDYFVRWDHPDRAALRRE
ncbi:hypothetical protein IU433_20650 [Nocardia puris]|uniref:Uridine kinase n=1 Tax=Nocardia puris TaxID=208602 RepID=A0A366E1X5_9NOCA|nr:hypothetical protein [Nocardia puris]MBF6212850.1 hypothetical protein [Nocardia puris]MBF6367784.1 hypothetical protein [Nocardia puris]MBF6461436.1 hypothetical protein [Nocardia puris]RBO96323.1 hypothetical protein DFR74_101334 [Nocardia puris]